jgi:predicted glycoside hydrolase/deacetylase ChbG (UPF0249 family)
MAQSLAERLGYKPTDRLLIVNADDVAMSHEANAATIDGMENGQITSGSIMVPCPWFAEIAHYAREHPNADFGLHLTHTSEWKRYKWRPLSDASVVPGLIDTLGNLWPSIEEVYENASPEQAEVEIRAQIELALKAGIDVTHLDSHMGTLQFDPTYHEVYLKLAKEYDVPMRVASQETLDAFGMVGRRERVREDGVLFPDYMIYQERKEGEITRDYWKRMIASLKVGVTELYIHPAKESDALKRMTNRWETRVDEYRLFTNDVEMMAVLKRSEVILIGWRALRELQRKNSGIGE